MNLLEFYKTKNRDLKWFERHSSLNKKSAGRLFEYVNTNYRKQDSFSTQFKVFLEIENLPRNEWPRQQTHGQEKHKQHVVNMIQSKLFKKDKNELYSRTEKGKLYYNFINSEISKNERWLINYLFLINGYYLDNKNYIIHRVKDELLNKFLCVDGINENGLIKYARTLLKVNSLKDALRKDFFYLHSFYDDSDFLIKYFRSPSEEKEELAEYIKQNLKTDNSRCCISKKYQPGMNFNLQMLLDEVKVFLLTLLFVQSKDTSTENIRNVFVNNYNTYVSPVNEKLVLKYLYFNKNIFDPIFLEILELEEDDIALTDLEEDQVETETLGDKPESYIDETSQIGKMQIKAVFRVRKRQARIQGNYKCGLERINNCNTSYFTAKASGKNYLELHHLIPREFRNDFSYSIEVLANYTTLCPRCHRQIHFAVDRERKNLINFLFEDRKNRLKIVGLGLKLEDMYKYYKIEE